MKKLSLVLLLFFVPVELQAASRVWIAEFQTVRPEAAAPLANIPAGVHQPPLDISAGNKRSATFTSQTRFIRVICEVQCAIRAGVDATNSAIVLPALHPEYFGVQGGSIISVIAMP